MSKQSGQWTTGPFKKGDRVRFGEYCGTVLALSLDGGYVHLDGMEPGHARYINWAHLKEVKNDDDPGADGSRLPCRTWSRSVSRLSARRSH